MGVHILLSLPNGTATTAEMDQLYSKFKPRCSDSTIRVPGVKMAKHLATRKKCKEEKKKQANERKADIDADSMEESSESNSKTPCKKKSRRSPCNVSISNCDLANIVNGFPGNELAKKAI